MFPSADFFRLDWRSEFKKLEPFLRGRGAVVRIDIASDEAAPDKFNHILKEDFGIPGNASWLSLRIDHDWSTTYTVDDQIVAFAKKLAEAGIEVNWPQTDKGNASYFSENDVDGDLTINVTDSTFVSGFDASANAVRARIGAVCEAVQHYVAIGGHLMVIVNDMITAEQGRFWKMFWNAGLREAGGANLLLVYFVGPICGHEPHADAPAPEVRFSLPTAIEGDDSRENDVNDDIIDLFTKAGYSIDEGCMAANSVISGHGRSVRAVQMGLAKLIWRMKLKSNGVAT